VVFYQQPYPDPFFAWLIFYLAFAVNFPHFLLSYQLLYMDFGHLIWKKFSFFWAAVIVPAMLIGGLAYAAYYVHSSMLGYFANALYFFVGWHYTKQIYGGVVVTNALHNVFYSKIERWAVKSSLYSIWLLSWIWSNASLSKQWFYGIPYETLNFPMKLMPYCYTVAAVTFVAVLILHARKFIRERKAPAISAVACYLSIYIWFLPTFYNPTFYFTVSFFHSLQYLPFVYAFRRNKVDSQSSESRHPVSRKIVYLYGYLLLSVITGAIFFSLLPGYIDSLQLFNTGLYGPTLAMFCFMIFLNIHHYFIDNVIWKGSNPEMRKYIFQGQ